MRKNTKEIGEIGEDTACLFLRNKKFTILGRNYWKKWGEIDIIAEKNKILHFVEVKTVSCENLDNVIYETSGYRPEENVHPRKLQRLSRVIQTYLLDKGVEESREWQIDVLAVFLDVRNKEARCRLTENVVL